MTKERLAKIKALKDTAKAAAKGKPFKTMSAKDKDALLEKVFQMLGLIEVE